MLIRLGGSIAVLRLIGPADYGVYTAAAAFVAFVVGVTQMGMEIYLIRQPDEPDRHLYDQVFTFLLVVSLLGTVIALAGSFVAALFIHSQVVLWTFRVLVLSVPINVLWAPAQARIERGFGYRRIGLLEVGGDGILYAVAIPLAVLGAGPWSFVAGWVACQTWLLVGSYVLAGMRPSLAWPGAETRQFLRHGLGYSTSDWLARFGALVNPVVVGRFVGTAGIGYVALATRLIETFGFALRVLWRVGMVTLSRVRDDAPRLRRAIEDGMTLYVLALGVPLAGFALVSRWLVPLVYGHAWTPAIEVFGLVACARVITAPAALQSTLMLSRGQNLQVASTVAVPVILRFVAALVFVPHLGVLGYGIASFASVSGSVICDRLTRRLASFSYQRVLPWVLGLLPITLFALVPWPWSPLTMLPLLVVVCLAGPRRDVLGHARWWWTSLRSARVQPPDAGLQPTEA